MLKPKLQDEAFLEDVKAAVGEAGLMAWWLGQSGFLVQYQGAHLLMDPYLSDSLTVKYAGTDKPHVRLVERVIAPERLKFVLGVTSSHNHTDHLDAETIGPLLRANPALVVIVPRANVEFAAKRLEVTPELLTPISAAVEAVEVGPFRLHAIPSGHEVLEQDENGEQRFVGYIVEAGPYRLYHSGDCVPYPGLVERLRAWDVDLAILPINGRDPRRGVAGNFSGEEAARLAKEAGVGLVVPCHYEMFEFNSVPVEGFERACQAVGQAYQVVWVGERVRLAGKEG